MGITFSIKHLVSALIVRNSEDDNRVIKTSPNESHTGNLLQGQRNCSIVFWLVDMRMTTDSHDFNRLGFWV